MIKIDCWYETLNKPLWQKTYLQTRAPSEGSDQTVHLRSLIRIFTGRILDSQGCEVLSCEKTKTLIRLRGSAGFSESSFGAHAGTFSHVTAQICLCCNIAYTGYEKLNEKNMLI